MIYLQTSAGAGTFNLVFFLAIFAVMYFFFLRPQVKKQKAQDQFVNEIKGGNTIVTSSGIIGKISKVEKNSITIITDNKTHLQVLHSAISKELTEKYLKAKNPTITKD